MKNPVARALALAGVLFILAGFELPAAALRGESKPATALTNDDVLKMVQAKLGETVIATKIRSSICNFDTSPDSLIKLKEAGVSDVVLAAMAEGGVPAATGGLSTTPPDPDNPLSPHDAGIYYVQKNPGSPRMTLLEPTVYSGGKAGGLLKTAFTYGIAKMQWKAIVRGNRAALRINEPRPTFYYYFEEKSPGLSYSGSFWAGATSPNEFIMARMEPKHDEREIVMMEMGAFRATQGARLKDTVAFDLEKIRPGVYKVQPRSDLAPGEYCIYYAGGTPVWGGQGTVKIFDFGIESRL